MANLDHDTNDFARDDKGNLDTDDIYIKCQYGNQIYYYGRNDLVAYIPSLGRGHNILRSIALDKLQIEDKIPYEELYPKLLSEGIVKHIMENDEESTAAELTEAKKSIEKLLEEINALHKELAEMITWLNQASEAISSAYSKAGRAKKDYDAVRAVCDAEKDAFKPRLDAAEALIAEKRGDVPDELMSKYLALKKNYVNPVAKVANNQCSGCYMMLPSAVVKRVAGKTSIVECENCGRILTM